ncbi:unnamed protein product, partial [Timema podura]|nr:unnamed protein product [Timema podura]
VKTCVFSLEVPFSDPDKLYAHLDFFDAPCCLRLFEFRKVMANRESCYQLVHKDYPVTITKSAVISKTSFQLLTDRCNERLKSLGVSHTLPHYCRYRF